MNKIVRLPHHLSEFNNPNEYDQLSLENKARLQKWIDERVRPNLIKSYNPYLTSYGLKHYFEQDVGLYISNGVFKGAMLAAGIQPKEYDRLNWVFQISKRFYK